MLWIFPNLLFYLRQVSFLTLIKNLFWFYYFKTILTIFTFVFFFCPDNFHINFHIFFILFIQRDLNKNFFHLNWLLLFVHNILVFTLFFYLFFFFFNCKHVMRLKYQQDCFQLLCLYSYNRSKKYYFFLITYLNSSNVFSYFSTDQETFIIFISII